MAILPPKYTSPGVADSGNVPCDMGNDVLPTRVVRLVVKLDEISREEPLDPRRAYEWMGRLWTKVEPVGCVLCCGGEHPSTLAISNDDGSEDFWCRQHGELDEVPYTMTKTYVVAIGTVTREGEEAVTDSLLIPVSVEDKAALINGLLDEAEAEESESGVE